jgi:hypothetical protein
MYQIRANKWLLYCLSAFFFATGAALWETINFTPSWTAGAPASLITLVSPSGINPTLFWVVVHSSFEIIFILTLIFNWKIKESRNSLLAIFVLYALTRVWTIGYFAHAIVEFSKIPYSPTIDASLTEKTLRWRHLNYIRTGIVVFLNLWMFLVFSRRIWSLEAKK